MRISDWSSDVCSSDLFARFEHLHHDVAAADEFTLHIELRDRGPIGKALDPLADLHVLKHVHPFIWDAAMLENGDCTAGKAALREQRGSLHEQDDIVAGNDVGNA